MCAVNMDRSEAALAPSEASVSALKPCIKNVVNKEVIMKHVKASKDKKSIVKRLLKKMRSKKDLNGSTKMENTRKLFSESTTSTQLSESGSLVEEFMSVSSTLVFDTEASIGLRASVPDVQLKKDPSVADRASKVSFTDSASLIEMPKYREMPELKTALWFTNEEMRRMKLSNLLNKR